MTRVLVAAASAIVRAGLESLLRSSGAVEVAGSVAEPSEYSGPDPDVIVVDWELGLDELASGLPDHSLAGVVVLADDPGPSAAAEALRAGARAVLPRQAGVSQILAAIEAVAAGLVALPAGELDELFGNPRPAALAEPLTPREIEVLAMLAEGQSNKAIAYRLGISEHTVKFHVTSIMAKLNAGSRTEAVTLGLRQGLIML